MRGKVKLSRLCCFHMMSWWPHWCTKTMKGDHVGDHYVCGIDLFFSAKRLVSFFSKEVDYPLSIVHNKINLSCPIWQISQVQCEPVHGTLHYTASSFSLMCLVLRPTMWQFNWNLFSNKFVMVHCVLLFFFFFLWKLCWNLTLVTIGIEMVKTLRTSSSDVVLYQGREAKNHTLCSNLFPF